MKSNKKASEQSERNAVEHTPTPSIEGIHGQPDMRYVNYRMHKDRVPSFIAKVNSHEALLAIVKVIAEQFNEGADKVYRDALSPHSDDVTLGQWVNEAIAQAEGR